MLAPSRWDPPATPGGPLAVRIRRLKREGHRAGKSEEADRLVLAVGHRSRKGLRPKPIPHVLAGLGGSAKRSYARA